MKTDKVFSVGVAYVSGSIAFAVQGQINLKTECMLKKIVLLTFLKLFNKPTSE